jgi:IS5 family transposase
MGRSRGGLTTKIHGVVDASGLPVHRAVTTREAHDNRLVLTLLSGLKSGAMLLADRGFDADYRAHNLVERFFNKIGGYSKRRRELRPSLRLSCFHR